MESLSKEIESKFGPPLQYLASCTDYSTKDVYDCIRKMSDLAIVAGSSTRVELGEYLVKQGFGALALKILRSLTDGGLGVLGEPRQQLEPNLSNLKAVCMNLTISRDMFVMRLELAQCGVIVFLFEELELLCQCNKRSTFSLLRGRSNRQSTERRLGRQLDTLMILSNCASSAHTDGAIRDIFHDANAFPIMMKYLQHSKEVIVKMKCVSILSCIVNEAEADVLAQTDGCISTMINLLKEAYHSPGSMVNFTVAGNTYTTGAYGLVESLNRLAVNDANKMEIVRHSGVPVIADGLIRIKDPRGYFTNACLETLWRLAFVDGNRDIIMKYLEDHNGVDVLKQIHASHNPIFREASTGLLWKLGLIEFHATKDEPPKPHNPPTYDDVMRTAPVMLSYQCGDKDLVEKVSDKLRAAGFKVLLAVDEEEGINLSNRTQAVERSSVVLICLTRKYKESIQSQTEATYAQLLQKDIISLMFDANFNPDGWLGKIAADKKCFHVYSDKLIEENLPLLIKDLNQRGVGQESAESTN